jgi:hypothetical protein
MILERLIVNSIINKFPFYETTEFVTVLKGANY